MKPNSLCQKCKRWKWIGGVGALVVVALILPGCKRGSASSGEISPAAFRGDPSKMPAADKAKMQAQQSNGAAASAAAATDAARNKVGLK